VLPESLGQVPRLNVIGPPLPEQFEAPPAIGHTSPVRPSVMLPTGLSGLPRT
jgi:hypothetical protein